MNTFRRLMFAGAAIAVPSAASLVFISCGGDDVGGASTLDGGSDSTVETGSDSAQGDGPFSDGTLADAPNDARHNDAQNDTGISLEGGGTADADAGTSDAQVFDGSIATFPGQVAAALCERLANCCFGSDASAFDSPKCLTLLTPTGFRNSSVGFDLADGGHVVFDPAKAQTCLNQLAALDCSANEFTTSVMAVLYPACFGAMTGTLPVGSPCRGAIECAPGSFCDVGDAGSDASDGAAAMTCQPIRAVNQPCSDFGNNLLLGETACSYRASGDTQRSCVSIDPGDAAALPSNAWFCGGSRGLDAGCVTNLACTTKMCGAAASCVNAENIVNQPTCTALTIVDAGGPG